MVATFEDTFEHATAQAATVPVSAGDLRRGDHVTIRSSACKILDVATSKTGKHGHAKVHIVAVDIFTGRRLEEVSPSSHTLMAPIVKTTSYQLVDMAADGRLSLLDDANELRMDLDAPANTAAGLRDAFDAGHEITVTVVAALGVERVQGFKVVAGGT